jgi:hypothetical protein
MKKKLLAVTVTLAVLFTGACSAQQAATTQRVIAAIIDTFRAEIPVLPAQDQLPATQFVALGVTLDNQLAQCISVAPSVMGTKGRVQSCFSIFATGLLSPAELAQLRVLSGKSQARVQLVVTGIVAAVNIWIAFDTPVVGPAPSAEELQDLRDKVLPAAVTLSGTPRMRIANCSDVVALAELGYCGTLGPGLQ